MALCEALRGPQGQDKPRADLNKYLIALHFVHSWRGIKWHNANKLNNWNGILNIQSKVSLKCKLPWSCPEQTTGEEGNMTAQPPLYSQNTHTQTHTHTHHDHRVTAVASLLLWIPLATAVEKFSGEGEGKAEQNGEKMRNKGVKTPWKLISRRFLYLFEPKDSRAKSLRCKSWSYVEPTAAGSQTQRPSAQQPQRSHSISSSTAHWQSTTACAHGRSSIYSGKHCQSSTHARWHPNTHKTLSGGIKRWWYVFDPYKASPQAVQQMSIQSFPQRLFPSPVIELANCLVCSQSRSAWMKSATEPCSMHTQWSSN